MKKEIYSCDICEGEGLGGIEQKQIQAIFTTEQTEGRSCKPYLVIQKLDICPACYNRILHGEALYGSGAQGYNKYYFKDVKEED